MNSSIDIPLFFIFIIAFLLITFFPLHPQDVLLILSLKYLLIQIQKELDKVYSDFKQVYFKKNNLKKEINSFLDSNNIYYSNLKKREATNKKLSEQKRQNELNVAINKYENWLEAIVTIRNKINALIHSNYFSELGVTSAIRETIGFSKNPHHQYF